MVAYNFQKRFVADIESGRKRQTIRKYRKHQKFGHGKLQLYTGMRTKKCRLIKEVDCLGTIHVEIVNYGIILAEGSEMSSVGKMLLAQADGFEDVNDFIEFFDRTYGLPFVGVMIRW